MDKFEFNGKINGWTRRINIDLTNITNVNINSRNIQHNVKPTDIQFKSDTRELKMQVSTNRGTKIHTYSFDSNDNFRFNKMKDTIKKHQEIFNLLIQISEKYKKIINNNSEALHQIISFSLLGGEDASEVQSAQMGHVDYKKKFIEYKTINDIYLYDDDYDIYSNHSKFMKEIQKIVYWKDIYHWVTLDEGIKSLNKINKALDKAWEKASEAPEVAPEVASEENPPSHIDGGKKTKRRKSKRRKSRKSKRRKSKRRKPRKIRKSRR
jgi:hypothetical protein